MYLLLLDISQCRKNQDWQDVILEVNLTGRRDSFREVIKMINEDLLN